MTETATYGRRKRLTESRVLALTILQDHIDRVADIVMSGTPDNMWKMVTTPLTVVSVRQVVEMRTRDQCDRMFNVSRARLMESGVNHYAQIARKAVFTDADTLYGEYESDRLRHGQRVEKPYRTGIHLRLIDGVWKQSKFVLLRRDGDWERAVFKIGDVVDPKDASGTDMRAEAWSKSREAREIGTENLRETGIAFNKNDFALFRTHFKLPHVFTTFDSSHVLENEDDLRKTFSQFRDFLDNNNVTELERDCIAANFVSPDEINMTHVTTIKSGEQLVREPYPVAQTLRLIDGKWLAVRSQSAIEDKDSPVHGTPTPSTTPPQSGQEEPS